MGEQLPQVDALRKPKSHYRETKVRRLIIVTAMAGPCSSRQKREMESAEQRGRVPANEEKENE
jgi:hypothetical protein